VWDTDHADRAFAWRWLVDRVSQILDLLRALIPGGVATAFILQVGLYLRERQQGRDRIKEIEAERDRDVAKIEATGRVEVAKLQVELQLERERARALTSSQLSIGSPSSG
jgi:hypothetical protein